MRVHSTGDVMKVDKFDFVVEEECLLVSLKGALVAHVHYSLHKPYQIEFPISAKRGHVHQVLAHVYTMVESGEDDAVPLDVALSLPHEEIIETLTRHGIRILHVAYSRITEALSVVLRKVGLLRLSVMESPRRSRFPYRDHILLRFEIHSKDFFHFWNHVSVPSGYDALDVVPAYHPTMKGKRAAHMLNGDTDYRTHPNAIIAVSSPEDARALVLERRGGSSWTHLLHPYHAKGTAIEMVVSAGALRTVSGIDELVAFLRAALEKSEEYVCVSGGFRAPYRCAHNMLVDKKMEHPTGREVRGSEEHCVWAYHTLQAEGALSGSLIPQWFLDEGWLEIYKDAEMRHGLY